MALPPLPPGFQQAELDAMLVKLKDEAVAEAGRYMRTRCPAALQPYLEDYIASLEPQPLPPNQVILTAGDAVRVTLAGGGDAPGSPGSAAILAGNLDFVQLGAP